MNAAVLSVSKLTSNRWAWHFLKGINTWKLDFYQKTLLTSVRKALLAKAHRRGAMSRRGQHFSQYAQAVGSPRLRVLLDLDQVLADFEGHFLEKYRAKFPDDPYIPSHERNTFYLRDQYAKLRADLPDKVRDIYNAEKFFLDLPEIEGAVEAAREMAAMEEVDVFICTSPLSHYRHCLHEKFQWVEEHLGQEWVDRTIITKDKTMVNGHILIDDRPRIRGACRTPAWEHVVFSSAHNVNTDIRGKQRLSNWTNGQWKDIINDFKKKI